jgi:hypothetical protein
VIDTITLKLYNVTNDEINSSTGSGASLYTNFTGNLTDGTYYANATVNDSFGNSNSSITANITFDTTNPSISFSCDDTSVDTGDTITCTCTATDNLDSSPSVSYAASPSTSSTGTFTTTCTATDDAGNNASSSVEYTVSSSSSSSSSSSTSSSHRWDTTFFVDEDQFLEGFSKILEENERFKVKVNGTSHYVGVIEIDNDEVTINVSSTPQQAVLKIGDSKKFEVTDDDYYDVLVSLLSINDSEANITVKSIYEKIPADELEILNGLENGAIGDTADTTNGENEAAITGKKRVMVWVIIILIIAVVLGIGGTWIWNKYKKKRYYHKGY